MDAWMVEVLFWGIIIIIAIIWGEIRFRYSNKRSDRNKEDSQDSEDSEE